VLVLRSSRRSRPVLHLVPGTLRVLPSLPVVPVSCRRRRRCHPSCPTDRQHLICSIKKTPNNETSNTRSSSDLRPTTCKCVHLVTRVTSSYEMQMAVTPFNLPYRGNTIYIPHTDPTGSKRLATICIGK